MVWRQKLCSRVALTGSPPGSFCRAARRSSRPLAESGKTRDSTRMERRMQTPGLSQGCANYGIPFLKVILKPGGSMPFRDECGVFGICLLYTSDAADEEDSVDL